ncbi:DUF6545 domain-containing protein [Streptomyces prunicolor]|uniref:DUF6545 domain-containing protein n=1 Tax=Streptomyces prunicolor TaxID=67348 RepID=UPI0003648BBB|nr:DUF6545 domain-containing protein [Streptomyces prunicolor]
MSETVATPIYLFMAAFYVTIGCWKGFAFLREPTLTLALIAGSFFVGGLNYIEASPAGYRRMGEAFDQPWIATLPIYLCILTCFAIDHILTLIWVPTHPEEPRRTRRTIAAWTVGYTVAAVIMTVMFLGAHLTGPAEPLKFNTAQADEPRVLVFLGVFLSALACATVGTWRRSRRAKLEDEQMQHAMRWFGTSMAVTAGYVVCSAPAVVAAAAGHHQLDGVGVLGSVFGVVGCLLTGYGMSGAAATAWLRERRDIAVLQPLWDLVVASVDKNLSFGSSGARPNRTVNVRWTLHRRIIEILDGIRALQKWVSDEPAQVVKALHDKCLEDESTRTKFAIPKGGLPQHDLEALATAAVLQHAVVRLQEARTRSVADAEPAPPVSRGPAAAMPGNKTAAALERARLVRVARSLSHPLVDASLLIVHTARRADQSPHTVARVQ